MSHLRLIHKNEHFIRDAYQDFILSRKAALLSPKTIEFYQYTAGSFVDWLEITVPSQLKPQYVRAFLADVASRGVKDSTIHAYARGIRAFLRFMFQESYIEKPISFKMPKVAMRRLPVMNESQMKKVIGACRTPRDKALVLLLIDTGLRRSEALRLSWGDIEIVSGLVRVRRWKGSKYRSVVVGIKTRRTLLKYRRTVPHDVGDPVFRLKGSGLRMALKRIGERAGIKLNAHILRRTFATLSLRAGINPLHLQALMGHSSLEMTRRYIQMVDDDLMQAHKEHGPIDHFLK